MEVYRHPRAMEPLLPQARPALVDEGEIPRSRVQEITGKAATVSAEITKLGLEEGYFEIAASKFRPEHCSRATRGRIDKQGIEA